MQGTASSGAVALTFDDGPNGRCTEAVLDALADVGAPATFFVLGANVEAGGNDALLARMVRDGHAIGAHSRWHSVRRLFFRDLTEADLLATRAAIGEAVARAGGAPPPIVFFRPPFGFLTAAAARGARDAGMHVVEWTVSVRDWERRRTADDVTQAILARVRAGDVVVLHDGNGTHQRSGARCRDRTNVAAVVRGLVPALGARGLRTAPLAEVLGLAAEPAAEPMLRERR
ncbi:MAG TPA: polysaccharide deacetylase family protein [Candidatus Binatia bacterium]|nr:polysaccharide deacetylase family protein [Candidatus Binatia bacterium]